MTNIHFLGVNGLDQVELSGAETFDAAIASTVEIYRFTIQ